MKPVKPVFHHMHALMQHVQKSIHMSRVVNILCLLGFISYFTFLSNLFSFPLMHLIQFKILQMSFPPLDSFQYNVVAV